MPTRVAMSATCARRWRRQQVTASAVAASADSWARRRGPKNTGVHGSTPAATVSTPAAEPNTVAATKAAAPVAVCVTAVMAPRRRTSTMVWASTPAKSASSGRRR